MTALRRNVPVTLVQLSLRGMSQSPIHLSAMSKPNTQRALLGGFLVAVSFLFSVPDVVAQRESFAMRVQGGIALTTYNASFSTSLDVIDCGQFDFGSASGPSFNAVLELRTADKWGIGIGVGYAGRSGSFKRTNVYPIRDTVTIVDTELTTTVELLPSLNFLELQPDFRIALLGTYEKRLLGLVIGPRFALPLSSRFEQQETVVQPQNAAFVVDGQRTQQRTIASAVFSTRSSVLFGGSISLESFITVSDNVAVVPQLSFDYFANSILTDADWKLLGVRAEVGIRFGFKSKAEATVVPREPDPVPPPPPIAIDERPPFIELEQPTYTAEVVTGDELLATSPIINAVFFDSASATIQTTYRRSIDGSLPSTDPIQAHSWVLVRIADILKRNPQGKITLEGATSEADEAIAGNSSGNSTGTGATANAGGMQLAERRAQTVKQILVDLGVDPSRIQTRALISPRIPSNAEYAGGREENRRVDLIVQNAPLQEWVTVQQFSEVRGIMNVRATPVKSSGSTMRIDVGGNDTTVRKDIGNVYVPFSAPILAGATTTPVRVSVESGSASASRTAIVDVSTLLRRRIDLETSDFEAILRFDYNSAELNDDVRSLLRQLIERLPQGSAITIYGSTDILGTDTRNKELSEQRASVTEAFIRSLVGNKFTIETSTSGTRFADLTPQGRFLNRSIRITARTK